MNTKQLRRIPNQSVIGGVAAGVADYLGMDKAIVRLVFVLLLIFGKGFPIILIYIILWAALPKAEPDYVMNTSGEWSNPAGSDAKEWMNPTKGAQWLGYGLIVVGGFMLFDRLFYWMDLDRFIPSVLLIGAGLFFILRNNDLIKPKPTVTDDWAPTSYSPPTPEPPTTPPSDAPTTGTSKADDETNNV
jgi:phage shock protein C